MDTCPHTTACPQVELEAGQTPVGSQEQDPRAWGTDPASPEEISSSPEIQEHLEVWDCWEVAWDQLQVPQILPTSSTQLPPGMVFIPTLKQSLEGKAQGDKPFVPCNR